MTGNITKILLNSECQQSGQTVFDSQKHVLFQTDQTASTHCIVYKPSLCVYALCIHNNLPLLFIRCRVVLRHQSRSRLVCKLGCREQESYYM
jgi:hypothetical protein